MDILLLSLQKDANKILGPLHLSYSMAAPHWDKADICLDIVCIRNTKGYQEKGVCCITLSNQMTHWGSCPLKYLTNKKFYNQWSLQDNIIAITFAFLGHPYVHPLNRFTTHICAYKFTVLWNVIIMPFHTQSLQFVTSYHASPHPIPPICDQQAWKQNKVDMMTSRVPYCQELKHLNFKEPVSILSIS